ncbi:hypothetical protein VNO78_35368 [Psophocarpus tetragonolobus]|uniref:Uncharacterized protein n=1 Tax=Psophocarpus tetragonolobus TaxID=3891 RepID=A0AAN9RGT4_PSOTE
MASGATCVKDSMVHGILQFTPSIAFRYVLHRCRAEISVAESHFASCVVTTPAGHRLRVPKNRPLQFQFPWHTKRRGSPTETLLRLLLPLNDKVQWTSHNVAGSEPPTSPQSEHFTGPFNRASGVLKATSADPWSASFMVETRTLFVFHKSKNFTSDYEIRMPPTVPVNHYSDPEGQHNRIRILWCYPMLMYPERRLAFEHSNFFKVTAPEARPGQLRPGAHRRQKGRANRCTPEADRSTHPRLNEPGIVIYCHYLPVSGLGNCAPAAFLGCGSRFSGSSPESNPNSPSPVTTMDQPGKLGEKITSTTDVHRMHCIQQNISERVPQRLHTYLCSQSGTRPNISVPPGIRMRSERNHSTTDTIP